MRNGRRAFVFRRFVSEFLPRIPEKVACSGRCPGKVRAGYINDRNFQTFRIGLTLPADTHVHAIGFAVAIAVEFRFHPQVVMNPLFFVFEFRDDLSFSVAEHGDSLWLV